MDRNFTEEFPQERTVPDPPPLPEASTTNHLYENRFIKKKSPMQRHCSNLTVTKNTWDCLFDEGYRADVFINTDNGGIIYAHASILGMASPVFKSMLKLKQSKSQCSKGHHPSISIRGVPPEAVQTFIRFLYSSSYEEDKMQEHALSLLVLSHAYAIPHLKQECELQLEQGLLTIDNVVDIFQLALLCDAPRLSLFCHRFMLKHFKAISDTEGWEAMKESHPVLEKQILKSVVDEEIREKKRVRKIDERKVYIQLYEAMEALVHICKDGCQTIGPYDKVLKKDQTPCKYASICKGLELLIRHFAKCELRVSGGCIHCKRMWQVLELHSRLCVDSDVCRVPLCRNFKQKRKQQNKKDELKWRILVRKIVRSKSISGSPFFSLGSST